MTNEGTTSIAYRAQGLAKRAAAAIVIAGAVMLTLTVIGTGFVIAKQPTTSLADVVAQGQLVLASFQVALAIVIAMATCYYAKQSRDTVREMRAAREQEASRVKEERDLAAQRELRALAARLILATNRCVAAAARVDALLRLRRPPFGKRRQALDALTRLQEEIVEISASMNVLSYIDDALSAAAGDVLDAAMALHDVARQRRPRGELERQVRVLREARERVQAHLRDPVRRGGRA